jgi:hypothetical protein
MSVRATGTSSKNATYKLDPEFELAEMKDSMKKFCEGAKLMHKRQPTSAEFIAGKRKIYEAADMVAQVDDLKYALQVLEPEQHDMLAQVVDAQQPEKKIKAAEADAPEPVSTKVVMYAPTNPEYEYDTTSKMSTKVVMSVPTNPEYDTTSKMSTKVVMSAPTYVASKIQESIRFFSGAAAAPKPEASASAAAASAAPAPKITVHKAEDKFAAPTIDPVVVAETNPKMTKVVVKTDVVKTNVFELNSEGDDKVVVKTEVVKTEVLELSSDEEETPAPKEKKTPIVVVSQPAEQIKKASLEKQQDLSDDDQPLMKRVSNKKPPSARGVSKKNAPAGGASKPAEIVLAQKDGFWTPAVMDKMLQLNGMRIYNFVRMTNEVEEALGKLPEQAALNILEKLANDKSIRDANAFVLEHAKLFTFDYVDETESEREEQDLFFTCQSGNQSDCD